MSRQVRQHLIYDLYKQLKLRVQVLGPFTDGEGVPVPSPWHLAFDKDNLGPMPATVLVPNFLSYSGC